MIECQRASMPLDHLLHQQKVPMPIFLLTEDCRHDLASRIINGGNQTEPGPTLTQPSMATAVDLHQHAFLGVALAPTTMLRLASFGLRQQMGTVQDAMHTGPRELDPLAFFQQVPQMLLI